MQVTLKAEFPPFRNSGELRAAIQSICAKFGRITQLEILRESTPAGAHCACFLRLNSPKAETAFLKQYRAERFAGDIYFTAPLAGR